MKKALVIGFVFLLAPVISSGQVPLGASPYGWVYEYVEHLVAAGYLSPAFKNSLPYQWDNLFDSLAVLQNSVESGTFTLPRGEQWLVDRLLQEQEVVSARTKVQFSPGGSVRSRTNAESEKNGAFWGDFAYHDGEKFSVLGGFFFDQQLAREPAYPGKVWRGWAGDIDRATAHFALPWFFLSLGRDRLHWGPGRSGSLILSRTSPSLDFLALSGQYGWISFVSFAGVLDALGVNRSGLPAPDSTIFYNRYLSGHRVELFLWRKLALGFSETVVYGGQGRTLEPYYLNPLFWFQGAQLNANRDDNTFAAIDFSFYPVRTLELYGQLLLDDFQIEKKTQSDQEPNEIGYQTGFFLADPFSLTGDFNLEYTRVANRTYNQALPYNRYLNRNQSLGYPSGPDGEHFFVSFRKWLPGAQALTGTYQYHRQGEGKIAAPWTTPWLSVSGAYHEPFPSGVVERTDEVSLLWQYAYRRNVRLEIETGFRQVKNLAHQAGQTERGWLVGLGLQIDGVWTK